MSNDKKSKIVFILVGIFLLLVVNIYIVQLSYTPSPYDNITVDDTMLPFAESEHINEKEFTLLKYKAMALSTLGICFLIGVSYWLSNRQRK